MLVGHPLAIWVTVVVVVSSALLSRFVPWRCWWERWWQQRWWWLVVKQHSIRNLHEGGHWWQEKVTVQENPPLVIRAMVQWRIVASRCGGDGGALKLRRVPLVIVLKWSIWSLDRMKIKNTEHTVHTLSLRLSVPRRRDEEGNILLHEKCDSCKGDSPSL
jgi:hypothetical protein